MTESFIRDRITELRVKKGVSEYKMSYDLGHSRGYIYNISSGKALPPMKEFLQICAYLGVTPAAFFSEEPGSSALVQKASKEMETLREEDVLLIINLINRLKNRS